MKKIIVLIALIISAITGFAETTPPAGISNLTALTGTEQGKVDLEWTAPGNDGMEGGNVSGYLVKYATFQITDSNFFDSTISTFTQTWIPADAGTEDTGTVTGLTPAKLYYFAIKAFDADNNFSSWSTDSVNTLNNTQAKNSPPTSFNLKSPENGVIISTDTPDFDWYDSTDPGDIMSYTIWYSSYSNFSIKISSVGISSSTYKPTLALQENATYWWNVRAIDADGLTTYSSTWTVCINVDNEYPASFDLVSPDDGYMETATKKPFFDWNDSSDADPFDTINYTVWYSTRSDFAVKTTSGNLQVSQFTPATNLTEDATYWWCVRAIDSDNLVRVSLSTRCVNINTTDDPPSAFGLIAPVQSIVVQTATPLLDWQTAIDPDRNDWIAKYRVDWAKNQTFSSGANFQDNVLTSEYTLTAEQGDDLADNTTYWWKVTAYDFSGHTAVTSTSTFRVNKTQEYPVSFNLLLPANTSIETIKKPTFDWLDSSDPDPGDSITYTVWYSTRSDFSVKITSSNIQVSSLTVTVDLLENNTYWWSVRAIDSTGRTKVSNSTWTIRINALDEYPASFDLSSPSNGQIVTDKKPTFSWQACSDPDPGDSVTYTLWYSTHADFSVKTTSAGIVQTQCVPEDNLIENATYWWNVRAIDSDTLTTVSNSTRTVRINSQNDNPNTFNCTSPSYNAQTWDLTPQLSWEGATDPDPGDYVASYTLHYSTDSNFIVYTQETGITDLSYTIPTNLANNTTYYWKVQATDTHSSSTVTSAFKFYTNNHAPNSFALDWPDNGEIITTWMPTIDWDDSTDPDAGDSITYKLMYSLYSNFSSSTVVSGLAVSQSSPESDLSENTTYWYKVQACDTNNTMTESSTYSFRTNKNDEYPGAFSLLLSSGIVPSKQPPLDWQDSIDPDPGDVVRYTLYYSSYSNFSTSFTKTDLSSSTYNLDQDLLENTTYWWFVRSSDNDGYNVFSSTWSMRINADNEYPVAFNLVSPLSGTTVQTQTPTFTWNASSDPDPGDSITYTFCYARNAFMTGMTMVSGIGGTSYTPGAGVLTENLTYWWCVRAIDSDNLYRVSNSTNIIKINAQNNYPNSFSLSAPAPAATLTNTVVTMSWQQTSDPDPGGTVTYTLVYSTYSNFSSSIVKTGLTVTTTQYTLTDNRIYYWKVIAVDSTSLTTECLSSRYFTVNTADQKPADFDLLLPVSGTVLNTRKPLFDWQNSSDPDPWDMLTYTIKYTTDETFTTYTSSAGHSASQFTPASNLNENATYWWSVTAIDSDGLSKVSLSTFYFRINQINDPPAAFSITSPSNASTSINKTINFTWGSSSDPDPNGYVTYTLIYSTYSNFISSTLVLGLINPTTSIMLADNTIYYWKVVAIDSTSLTTESLNSWYFTVNQANEAPGAFNLLSPVDDTIVTVLRPTFDWEEAAPVDPWDSITYKITYSVDPAMPPTNSFVEQGLVETKYTPINDLVNNTTYYWKITAYDKFNMPQESSQQWSFLLILANDPPGVFELSSPAHGSAVNTRLPLFTWQTSIDPNPDDSVVYTLYYSTYSSFIASCAITNITGSQYQMTSNNILFENRTYYWRVQAWDDEPSYRWSTSIYSFTIPILTVPSEVVGVKGQLSNGGESFYIEWEHVDTNDNGSAMDDLTGYRIYTAETVAYLGSGSPKITVSSSNNTWTDTDITRKTMYYTVKAFDDSGIEGRNSLAIELSDKENLVALSDDNTVSIIIPKSEGSIFYRDTSPYNDNMKITIDRNSDDEGGIGGRVLRSFEINLVNSEKEAVPKFSFNTPVELNFSYDSFNQSASGFGTMADESSLGLFWYNGVEYVKLGGMVNPTQKTISLKTKQLGKYRVLSVLRATSFEFVQVWPKKIFTPNNDGINDSINFLFENPKLSEVTGEVYDIHGALVADLAMGDDYSSMIWDGKDKHNSVVRKGIYIYQIKCEGKIYNGAIVVAK